MRCRINRLVNRSPELRKAANALAMVIGGKLTGNKEITVVHRNRIKRQPFSTSVFEFCIDSKEAVFWAIRGRQGNAGDSDFIASPECIEKIEYL